MSRVRFPSPAPTLKSCSDEWFSASSIDDLNDDKRWDAAQQVSDRDAIVRAEREVSKVVRSRENWRDGGGADRVIGFFDLLKSCKGAMEQVHDCPAPRRDSILPTHVMSASPRKRTNGQGLDALIVLTEHRGTSSHCSPGNQEIARFN
jgi:hypothetical protein